MSTAFPKGEMDERETSLNREKCSLSATVSCQLLNLCYFQLGSPDACVYRRHMSLCKRQNEQPRLTMPPVPFT